MTKQLYEEALADVKRVKEIAEANAQRAIIEAVAPRIRDLIERELLSESGDNDDMLVDDVVTAGKQVSSAAGVSPTVAVDPASSEAISGPDGEGKVTLDLDALSDDLAGSEVPAPLMGAPALVNDEYELNAESVNALSPLLAATARGVNKELELRIYRFDEALGRFKSASPIVRRTKGYVHEISQMISRVEDMYDHVQESVSDPAKKTLYENKLETYFTELNTLQEPMMSQNKKRLHEEDVTMKLTGLPDDIDLESIGVDLITGEEGEEGGDDLELDAGDDGGDLGGDEGGEGEGDFSLEDESGLGEALRLSDDTIVEIDAKMLRKELTRMRKLREEALPSTVGKKLSGKDLEDFGGGCDEGDPLDQDIADLSPAKAALPLGESDGDLDEADELDESDDLDEADELDEIGDKRTRDQFSGSATSVPSLDKSTPAQRHEALARRVSFEKNLQERTKSKLASIKKEAIAANRKGLSKKVAALKEEYASVAVRFNESIAREQKTVKLMAESARLQNGARPNGAPKQQQESEAVKSLRNKLSDTNLINAKLVYANKLLQNEALTAAQKKSVISNLNSAKTVREAKLVYESLSQALSDKKLVSESADRKVLSSSSRASRPAATQALNESTEADRWAKLAGIKV